MGKELMVVEPAIEPELFTMAVQLGSDSANDEDEGNTPEVFVDEGFADVEEFEAGIASVFGSLRADLETGAEIWANDDEALDVPEVLELEPADLLLAELNRLWASPLAA